MHRRTLLIGTIAGVPIQFHWSWIAVLLLVVAILGPIYAHLAPAHSALLMAIAAALFLCLSVLLHEVGHTFVARRYGLTVHAITLFAMGGMTEISDTRAEPKRDFWVALAGPLVNMLLALLGVLVWWQVHDSAIALLVLHLALTNGFISIFNLLPGYPLDGGRILCAVISYLSDDELLGARWTGFVGRLCGWALLGAAVLYSTHTRDVWNGIWVGFVGYFLARNATRGYRQFVLRHALRQASVADLMQRVYHAVAPNLPLDQFVGQYILGRTEQGFPVLLEPDSELPQPLLGMMTLHDLRRFRISDWALTQVGDAMTPLQHLCALAPTMPAGEAFRWLIESGEELLPVIDGVTLLGVLHKRDLVTYVEQQAAVLG